MTSRCTKMTTSQKERLVRWLERPENQYVLGGRHVRDAEIVKTKWDEAAALLNSVLGPRKTGDRWRKTFNEMRCHINKKHRQLCAQRKLIASGKPTDQATVGDLTDVEKRFLVIFGKNRVNLKAQVYNSVPSAGDGEQYVISSKSKLNSPASVTRQTNRMKEERIETEEVYIDEPIEYGISSDSETNVELPSLEFCEAEPEDNHKRNTGEASRLRLDPETALIAERAVESFASATREQAAAMRDVAAAINRSADVQEQASLRLNRTLQQFFGIFEENY